MAAQRDACSDVGCCAPLAWNCNSAYSVRSGAGLLPFCAGAAGRSRLAYTMLPSDARGGGSGRPFCDPFLPFSYWVESFEEPFDFDVGVYRASGGMAT